MSTATPIIGTSPTPLRRRLERYYNISARDGMMLDDIDHLEMRLDSREDVLARGARNDGFLVVQSGWACRYRMTQPNKRQILNFLLPGDIVNPDSVAVSRTDHGIRTLTAVTCRCIQRAAMRRLLRTCPSIIAALWWSNAQEKGVLQAQIVRLGRQSAIKRVGNILLELHRRLLLVQLATEHQGSFALPLTQRDIGDALGLSSVHVSRVLTELRRRRLIRRAADRIQLLNPRELAAQSDFELDYLHLDSQIGDSLWS